MNETELAWVAGLLEGEGSFFFKKVERGQRLTISLLMSDYDVVEKYAKLVGVTAKIWTVIPKGDREGHKTMYGAAVQGHAGVRLMKKILPHMGLRRSEKIKTILAAWDALPHRREPGLPPVCHPNRKHNMHGLCKECATRKRRREMGVKSIEESLTRIKPWDEKGMTRSVWYHRGFHRTYQKAA